MQLGVIVRRESVGIGQVVHVGHGGTADNVGIAGVFFDDNEDMAKLRIALSGSWSRRRNICSPPAQPAKEKTSVTNAAIKATALRLQLRFKGIWNFIVRIF